MARPYRLQGEGLLYHITSRGDDRKKIFLNESDYLKFLGYLKILKKKFNFYLYAFCLMGNHYHLLLETTQPNLSRIMQSLNTSYTAYYNVKRKRCGHLFQGRFKSILVDKDNYLNEVKGGDYAHKKIIEGIDPEVIIQKAAEHYKQAIENLRGAKKKPLLARKVAVYLLKKYTALTNREIGREFGIGYSGVSWVASDVERLIEEDPKIRKDIEAINLHLKV